MNDTRVNSVKNLKNLYTVVVGLGLSLAIYSLIDTTKGVFPIKVELLPCNQSYVLINGCRAPVRGRVCMNFIMVDVTDIPDVKLEDEAVLIGQQGNEKITADYLAQLMGTINYEVVTRINWQIPRIVT
jgi:alanine racemase